MAAAQHQLVDPGRERVATSISVHPGALDEFIEVKGARVPKDGRGTDLADYGPSTTAWPVPKHWHVRDYVAFVVALPMLLAYLPLYVVFTILLSLPLVVLWVWTLTLKWETPVPKYRISFALVKLVTLLVGLPGFVFLYVWAFVVFVYLHAASVPFALIRIFLLFEGPAMLRNFSVLGKFSKHHPWNFDSLCRAVSAQLVRQGLSELVLGNTFVTGGVGSTAAIPILKYAWLNPLVFNLQISFVNQWTMHLKPEDKDFTERAVKELIGDLKPAKCDSEDIDDDWFAPAHPHPSRHGQAVNGFQYGDWLSMFSFSKTRWCMDVDYISSPNEWVDRNLMLVEISYWNPFYVVIGDVEVNLDKDGQVSHPMYCVSAKNSYLSHAWFEKINRLFAKYVPGDFEKWIVRKTAEYKAHGA